MSSSERLDQALDTPSSRLLSLCPFDVIDVLASEPEGKPVEGGSAGRVRIEGVGQVGRLIHHAWFGVELERHFDLVSLCNAGCRAIRGADADQVPPALRSDTATPRVAIDADGDLGPLAVIECVDDLGGHLGTGCVASWNDRGEEGLGVQRPIPA
jgi:hypothetical protein